VKIRPVEAELYHTDGRTDERTDRRKDIKKLKVAFRNFAKRACFENAPNEWHIELHSEWYNGIIFIRACTLQPTGRPHNSLYKSKIGGRKELTGRSLLTNNTLRYSKFERQASRPN